MIKTNYPQRDFSPYHFLEEHSILVTWNRFIITIILVSVIIVIFIIIMMMIIMIMITIMIIMIIMIMIKVTWQQGELCDKRTFPLCTQLSSQYGCSPCICIQLCICVILFVFVKYLNLCCICICGIIVFNVTEICYLERQERS